MATADVLDICARLRNSKAMLSATTLHNDAGIEICDVACRHRRGRGLPDEQAEGHALVFVRRGCFVRSSDGVQSVLDPTLAYCMNPGEEQRYDHPHDHGDDCTSLFIDPELVASIWGGDPMLPRKPLPTSPEIDIAHRALLSAARRGIDPDELFERAIVLSASALEQAEEQRVKAGRPVGTRARRTAADGVREILAESPERSLPELARELSVSPHHLSRVFRAMTGHTIARHRMRLRTRAALDRLAEGEQSIARLAAELGFADQSHLCRVVRQETGRAPSVLRELLT